MSPVQGLVTEIRKEKTNGMWTGYTTNYIKVYVSSTEDLENKLLDVIPEEIFEQGVLC